MHVALSPVTTPLRPADLSTTPAATPRRFGALLEGQRPCATNTAPIVTAAPVRLALQALERSRNELDAAVAAARGGRTFSPAELLALQSQAHRYGESVELASKVVEQAAQAVKQAVNTQV